MIQEFKFTTEVSIWNEGFTDSDIKQKVIDGLENQNFYSINFESFERISFTKEEAIEAIANLYWKNDNEGLKNKVAEIINRIS